MTRVLLLLLPLLAAGCSGAVGGCASTGCPSPQVCCQKGGAIQVGAPTTHCLAPVFNPDGGLGGYEGADGGPSGCLPEI